MEDAPTHTQETTMQAAETGVSAPTARLNVAEVAIMNISFQEKVSHEK